MLADDTVAGRVWALRRYWIVPLVLAGLLFGYLLAGEEAVVSERPFVYPDY